MILFKGEYYDLKYRYDRNELKDQLFYHMKTLGNNYSKECNMLNKLIDEGKENTLVSINTTIPFYKYKDEKSLSHVLAAEGYDVNTYINANSVYAINDEGESCRFSNHKPKKYKYELYVFENDMLVDGQTLINKGFSKVDVNETYFIK